MLELINQPGIREVFWFCMGIIVYRTASTVITHGHMFLHVQMVVRQVIILLASIINQILFINSVKYKEMKSNGHSEEEIERTKNVDIKALHTWANSVVLMMKSYCPKIYHKAVDFDTWEQACVHIQENLEDSDGRN